MWEWAGTEVDEAAHALGGAGPGLDVAARPAVAAAAPAAAAAAAHWPMAARLVFPRLVLVRDACIEPTHEEDASRKNEDEERRRRMMMTYPVALSCCSGWRTAFGCYRAFLRGHRVSE